ncbi:MAG: BrnT family toxin [Gemmatimonadota bacterium]|nr:BrnT family toxin [Gemmatimonadota bacterium]
MADLRIEWDAAKARANLRKHGISFDEAETAFSDDYALLLSDPDHSTVDEERLVLIGMSAALRVLVVVHCERDNGNTIRLISARRATRSERAQYDARWKQ